MSSTPRRRLPPTKERVGPILDTLGSLYPEAVTALSHSNPLQLLIATILSAQCTDARVNTVTPALFSRYQTAADFATADPVELETLIKPTGYFRSKAKNIIGCCRELVTRFGGEVPRRLEDLITLPGVGRKTANVVLGDAFSTPGITVDTHVGRLARRLGFTRFRDPVKVEHALMKLIPRELWTIFSHRLIFHGRQVCHSRKPACDTCQLKHLCPMRGSARARHTGNELQQERNLPPVGILFRNRSESRRASPHKHVARTSCETR